MSTLNSLKLIYDSPLALISSALRGFIIPSEGHTFVGADFSSIEARVLAWLANEKKALDVFNTTGLIYEQAASSIYHVPMEQVTKTQRQIGKVAVLSLGYQGGKGAFQNMAKNYGVKVSDEEAEKIKTLWREANPNIVALWYSAEESAMNAVRNPGKVYTFGANQSLKYRVAGSFLWCQLPSSRALCYPYPEIKMVDTPWGDKKEGIVYKTEAPPNNKWGECKTYSGSLVENITQAVARDILAESLVRISKNKRFRIVTHIHDEILTEVNDSDLSGAVEDLARLMTILPKWAEGLPVNAEGWHGKRYRK